MHLHDGGGDLSVINGAAGADIQVTNSREPAELSCRPARILIVAGDVIVREILLRKLRSLGYHCGFCQEGSSALEVLAADSYDLILLDIMMPEMGGSALLLDVLKICPDIATILIAQAKNIGVAVAAVKDGAYDYVTKPFSLEDVTMSVARALERRRLLMENREHQRTLEGQVASRTSQLKDALEVVRQTYHSTLLALGTALDSRDAASNRHSLRVAVYTVQLAQRMGLPEDEIRVLQYGALLHDIGKIGVPDGLLRKPGKLSEQEWILMRKHPEIGYRILSRIKFLRGAAELVLQHHERHDGTGYLQGLEGEGITLGARIFAVADTLDCMTSDRPFQAATDFASAYREILRVAGTQLDPRIVSVFAEIPPHEWQKTRLEVDASA